jgi:hypothetical protein
MTTGTETETFSRFIRLAAAATRVRSVLADVLGAFDADFEVRLSREQYLDLLGYLTWIAGPAYTHGPGVLESVRWMGITWRVKP